MAGAAWMRIKRLDQDDASLSGTLLRAAARGETIGMILEQAARGLLHLGAAERAGVWVESTQHPNIFKGTVVETGSGPVPEQWKRLDVSVPFFRTLLSSENPIIEEFGDAAGASLIGALAGMRSAAWLPLRVQQKTLGLTLVAHGRSRRAMHTPKLRRLADELAMVIAQRRDRELCRIWRAEIVSRSQVQKAVLQGTPANQILPRIAAEAARHTGALFVALGRSGATPQPFEFFEGPRELLCLLADKPISDVWQTAVAEGRPVEVGGEALWNCRPHCELFHSERLSRLVAIPLEARGVRLGVLLAALDHSAGTVAGVEQLESYAMLAAAALWEEHRGESGTDLESFQRTQLESTPGWILLLDHQGVVCEASRAALKNLGLQPARLGHVRLEQMFSPAACEAVVAWRTFAASAAAGGIAEPLEGALANGLTVRMHLRGSLPGRQQAEARWQVAIEDLTPLRAAERKGRQAEAELRSLLDSVDSGVLLFDRFNHIRLVNDRFAQLLGLEARRVAELGEFDALVEAVAGHFREPQAFAGRWRERVRRGDESSWDELELMRPTRKVLERFARPVLDAEGERIGWLEVYRDITNQRLIQSKLLQTEKMAALGKLVSGIAHELNNPLTSIMGYAQLLLGRQPGLERATDARLIFQEAERASRIVKNLLLFGREAKPERRPMDLNEVVERTLALRSYELKVENITVDFELDPELPTTLADALQMQQVVLNLVVNAEQAIQQGRGQGHIRVRTQRISPQRLALEVADDGPGIPPEIASRIFDPFFTTKPVGVGTGLGLSIVYGIVQEHGGEISVESPPGGGAAFLVELPVVAAAAAEASEGEVAPAAPALTVVAAESDRPAAAHRGRILVVEDEPTVAQLIADVLRGEGHLVDTVLDSREGLDRLSRQQFDLVICDLKMPHLDGRAFYRALVRTGSSLQHRIIFVTGDTLALHTLEFLDSTGLPYLAKPFLVEELKLAVQHALGFSISVVSLAAGGEADPAPTRPRSWPQDALRKR